jgi:hypothetical protein
MGPKMDSLLYAILGFLLHNRFVSPLWIRQTDTQGRGSPFRHACSLINYACFLASSPSFSTIMAKRNATAEELEAQAESNGYKTALETTGSTTIRLRGIKMWYWTAM